MRPWFQVPTKDRMELLRLYKSQGYSYRDAIDDFEESLFKYKENVSEKLPTQPIVDYNNDKTKKMTELNWSYLLADDVPEESILQEEIKEIVEEIVPEPIVEEIVKEEPIIVEEKIIEPTIEKPNISINFVDENELLRSKNPVEAFYRLIELKEKYNKLNDKVDKLWK